MRGEGRVRTVLMDFGACNPIHLVLPLSCRYRLRLYATGHGARGLRCIVMIEGHGHLQPRRNRRTTWVLAGRIRWWGAEHAH